MGDGEAPPASEDVVVGAVGAADRAGVEAELARRARQGDRDAYSELVESHRDVAFRVAYLVTGNAADAEDAAQEGFVKAYVKIHRLRPDAPFRPWLLRIVGNEARNRRRSEGRRTHYEARFAGQRDVSADADDPDWAGSHRQVHESLLAAVNELPEKERLVIGLRYFLGLSEQEIAHAAGIPKGTVKSRSARALARLRAKVGELDD